MTPGHLDIMAKGRMISDGNPLEQMFVLGQSPFIRRLRGNERKGRKRGVGQGLQCHVDKTAVEIGIRF